MYINVYIISPGLLNNYISPPNLETLEFTEKERRGNMICLARKAAFFQDWCACCVCVYVWSTLSNFHLLQVYPNRL